MPGFTEALVMTPSLADASCVIKEGGQANCTVNIAICASKNLSACDLLSTDQLFTQRGLVEIVFEITSAAVSLNNFSSDAGELELTWTTPESVTVRTVQPSVESSNGVLFSFSMFIEGNQILDLPYLETVDFKSFAMLTGANARVPPVG